MFLSSCFVVSNFFKKRKLHFYHEEHEEHEGKTKAAESLQIWPSPGHPIFP
jgi:hypothetical protein